MSGKIQFKCPQCQADFGVDAKFAGKPCRCKHCGRQFRIPGAPAQAAASPAAKSPPRQPVGAGVAGGGMVERAAQRVQEEVSVPKPTNWIDAVSSQIALKPSSMDYLNRVGGRAQQYMDEDVQSGPYEMASFPSMPLNKVPRVGVVKGTKRAYSNQLRILQKWLRWINETALELTVPFFILIPLGYILKNHWLSIFGFTMVVLLNMGRLIVGLANLLVIPFRESPMTGLLFLVPFPFGYNYLKNNWPKCRKPFQRIISPVCFMIGMILLYSFVPWFSHPDGQKVKMVRDQSGQLVPAPKDQQDPAPTLQERLEEGVKGLRRDIRGQVEDAEHGLPGATKKLEKLAGDTVDKAQDAVGNLQNAAENFKEKISSDPEPSKP